MPREQLEKLKEEIKKAIPDYWLFPLGEEFLRGGPGSKVRGFLGAAPIIFVGERPSTGKFPTHADRLLYRLLEKFGIPDAHLTDIIKSRAKVTDEYPADLNPHRLIFSREIEIVRPKKIIAMGGKAYRALQFGFSNLGVKIVQTLHYAHRFKTEHEITESFRGAITS